MTTFVKKCTHTRNGKNQARTGRLCPKLLAAWNYRYCLFILLALCVFSFDEYALFFILGKKSEELRNKIQRNNFYDPYNWCGQGIF